MDILISQPIFNIAISNKVEISVFIQRLALIGVSYWRYSYYGSYNDSQNLYFHYYNLPWKTIFLQCILIFLSF